MNERLKKELEVKEKFKLKYNQSTGLIELNLENVQKIETMLRCNPNYPQFIDVNDYNDEKVINDIFDKIKIEYNKYQEDFKNEKDEKDFKFQYASVFYILALKQDKEDGKLTKKLYEYYIKVILRRINAENHTHTAIRDINAIAKKVYTQFNYEQLLKALKEPLKKDCQYQLIRCIASEINKKHNFLLASQFCHYVNFYIYLDKAEADLFSIYDETVKDNLHLYYNYYCGNEELEDLNQPIPNYQYKYKFKDLKKFSDRETTEKLVGIYKDYQDIIGQIVKKCGISRNEFYHLVWYTSKLPRNGG